MQIIEGGELGGELMNLSHVHLPHYTKFMELAKILTTDQKLGVKTLFKEFILNLKSNQSHNTDVSYYYRNLGTNKSTKLYKG